MARMWAVFALSLAATLSSAVASAEDSTCVKPPEFMGCPTGAAAWDINGAGFKAGEVKYLNFGDQLVVKGGEGGIEAVTIWGVDLCGLWLQFAANDSYVPETKPPVKKPTYLLFTAVKKNVYKVEALGISFQLKQVFPGRFKVTLLDEIPAYQGE